MKSYKYLLIIFSLFLLTTIDSYSCACAGKASTDVYSCTSSDYGNATCYTSADVYQMTVTSGEFYNSTTGATWVLKSQNATYDITSQNFDYMPNIKKVKKGTYDKFRGYADNVFVVKGGFTTTDSKTCVTSGTQDSTYGDFRAAAIRTAGNKANVTITNKNFGSSTYHYTDANGNLIELIDTSGNRITSDNNADRIRVTYSLPTSMTLKETDSIDIKMLMKSTTSIRATYATSDGAGKYNCTSIGMRAPIFTMTVTQTPMQ